MKNLKLITIIATALLLTSIFAVIPVLSTQPPIDTSTYYVGTIGQPSRMDPARAYDTASGELIQNVAQTLIWWNDKNVISFTPGVGHNLTVSEYADLDSYTPVLATALPTVVVQRIRCILHIQHPHDSHVPTVDGGQRQHHSLTQPQSSRRYLLVPETNGLRLILRTNMDVVRTRLQGSMAA